MSDVKEPFTNYPSNSKTQKAEKALTEQTRPKVEKVVKGVVKRQKPSLGKRMAETLALDDTKNVKNYIVHDVLIPAAKSMICDIVGWGGFAEMILFSGGGGRRGPGSTIRRDGGTSKINYGSISRDPYRNSRDQPRERVMRARDRFNFDDLIIPIRDGQTSVQARAEAEDVLTKLFDLTVEYGQATVADLYDACGLDTEFTDNKWGWTDLRGVEPRRVHEGYILTLPKPMLLD